MNNNRTILNLKPGQRGRLIIEAKAAVNEESAQWKDSANDVVTIDKAQQKTPFDACVVAGSPGIGIIEFGVLDHQGERVLEHIFEIHVEEKTSDADLIGSARVSRESEGFEVPGTEGGSEDAKLVSDELSEDGEDEDQEELKGNSNPEPVKMGEEFPAPVSTSMEDNPATAIGDTSGDSMPANEASSEIGEELGAGSSPEAIAEGEAIREENTPAALKGEPIEGDSDMMAGHKADAAANAEVSAADAEPTGSTELPADYPPDETKNEAETPEEIAHAEEETQVIGGDVGPNAVSTAAEETGATTLQGDTGAAGDPEEKSDDAGTMSFDSSDEIILGDDNEPRTLEDVTAGADAISDDAEEAGKSDEERKPGDPFSRSQF